MTEITIQPKTEPESQAHIDAMVAKAEGREVPAAAPEGGAAERPAWLPEGFNTPEELAAAYAEATKTKSEPPVEGAEANAAAAEAVTKAGLDMSALEAKVVEKGALDADDYAALEKAGIPKNMVDAYIAGQMALGEQLTQRVHAHVGGKEAFDEMLGWASQGGITAAEADVFNRAIDNGDEAAVMLALDALRAKFVAAGRNTPNLLGGGRGGQTTDVYASIAQMQADMRDPRYSKDPAFRSAVEQKLARSDIF